MDVEQQLRNALRDGARDLDLQGAGPASAQRRARRIANRRKAVPAALLAATVGTTATVVWARQSNNENQVTADGGTADSTVSGGPVEMNLEWRAADATVVQRDAIFAGSDGVYYALATAPGTRIEDYPQGNAPQAIYRSSDGTTWESSAPEDPWMSSLRERDGVLYAIGTAPAANGDVETRVGMSTDNGDSFESVTLPTEATPPAVNLDLQLSNVLPHIAVGEDRMIATVTTSWWFDPDALLEPAEREQARFAQMTEEGVQIMDAGEVASPEAELSARPRPEFCPELETPAEEQPQCAKPEVVRTIPWSQLGLTSIDDLSVTEWFTSTDGTNWQRMPAPYDGFTTTELSATPHGFFASGSRWAYPGNTVETRLARTIDGETWQDIAADGEPFAYVGTIGTRLVAVRQGTGMQAVTSDDGGTTWSPVDVGALIGITQPNDAYVAAFDAGPLGVAVVIDVFRPAPAGEPPTGDPASYLLTSPDGVSWSVTTIADIAAEAGIAEPQTVDWVVVGPDNIVLTATRWGSTEAKQSSHTFVGTPVR
jgi:hypothetical protein